jgi:hypothetical protein
MLLRAQAQTVTFAAIDSSAPPARKSGLTFATGDCKIWNGSAFVNTTNLPAEIGSTGRYSLLLTATEMRRAWLHYYVTKTGMQDVDDSGSLSPGIDTAVVADAGNSATTFVTDLTSSVTDFYKDALFRFTSGNLAGQVKKITGYNGTTKALSFSPGFTAAPATNDLGLIVTT